MIWIETLNYDIHKIFIEILLYWTFDSLNYTSLGIKNWCLWITKGGNLQRDLFPVHPLGFPFKTTKLLKGIWKATPCSLTPYLLLFYYWLIFGLCQNQINHMDIWMSTIRILPNIVQLVVLSFHWKEKEIIRKFPLWKEILVVAKRRWDLWSY